MTNDKSANICSNEISRISKKGKTMSVPSCSTSKESDSANIKEEETYAKWERFSNWVHCICIVTFDLELGQAIEVW